MKKIKDFALLPNQQPDNEVNDSLPGYPIYPAEEDIFAQFKEAVNIDPENLTSMKAPNEPNEYDDEDDSLNGIDQDDDLSGDDLDVPGSELDDDQEDIGNEDEENNYYSLGGDNHNDLDEDQGD